MVKQFPKANLFSGLKAVESSGLEALSQQQPSAGKHDPSILTYSVFMDIYISFIYSGGIYCIMAMRDWGLLSWFIVLKDAPSCL